MEFNYSKENNNDIIRMFKRYLDNGSAILKEDGKIQIQVSESHDAPWYHVRPDDSRKCVLRHNILFPGLNLVPIRCHSCWKVIVRPRTLKELFKLSELQEKCGYYCKCGIEVRKFVSANYGGYFYFDTMKDGFDALDAIREMVWTHISPDVSVFLKRGCTEFEMKIPNSRNWAVMEDQMEIEKYILDRVELSATYEYQSPDQVLNVKRRWVEFACDRGDMTYMEFNGGNPLFAPPVTYERPV